jgi:hypothetical protein
MPGSADSMPAMLPGLPDGRVVPFR